MTSFVDALEKGLGSISDWVWGPPLLILLVGTHLFLTFRLRFIQRYLFKAIKISLFGVFCVFFTNPWINRIVSFWIAAYRTLILSFPKILISQRGVDDSFLIWGNMLLRPYFSILKTIRSTLVCCCCVSPSRKLLTGFSPLTEV